MADRDPDIEGAPELPPASSSAAAGHEGGHAVYKSGHGYWTRICTVIGLALLVVAACAWAVEQCTLINVPNKAWSMVFSATSGAVKVGDTIELRQPQAPKPFATAVVQATGSSAGRTSVVLDAIVYADGPISLREAKIAGSASGFTAQVASVDGIPAYSLGTVQTIVGGVILAAGAGLIYWLVGLRPRTVDFLIATDGEMKKVNWSSRKTIMDSTWMVVGASVIIAALIYIIDLVFQWFFSLIGVLQK